MPIFEYRCVACGEKYEELVPRSDSAAPPCPECGGVRADRLVSAFAVGRSTPKPSTPGRCGSDACRCRAG